MIERRLPRASLSIHHYKFLAAVSQIIPVPKPGIVLEPERCDALLVDRRTVLLFPSRALWRVLRKRKPQTANPNTQKNAKSQYVPFGHWGFFGVWGLVFGVSKLGCARYSTSAFR